jgi:integrase
MTRTTPRTNGQVLVREGVKGTVYKIRYRDAGGKRVQETLGSEHEGWTDQRAAEALQDRLSDVRREGYRAPDGKVKLGPFAQEWLPVYAETKGLKRSTRESYKGIIEGRLVPAFGSLRLHELDPERIERQIAKWTRAGMGAQTINNTLNVLSRILKTAIKRKLVASNPVALVDRPKARRSERRVLTPAEIGRVLRAFGELIDEATGARREDLEACRMAFALMVDSGIRKAEALGLRWSRVFLADPNGPRLRIEETFTCNRWDTPKSEAGKRTIEISDTVAAMLMDYRAVTPYKADHAPVLCNPRTGHPFDPHVYSILFREALTRAEIEGAEDIGPFHDLRRTSLTSGAAAGVSPIALQARAGHSSFATTRRYLMLAGVGFETETAKHSERLWGGQVEAIEAVD